MAINTNAQNVIIGDSLVDYCTYQESASRYAIPGKNHMGQPMNDSDWRTYFVTTYVVIRRNRYRKIKCI